MGTNCGRARARVGSDQGVMGGLITLQSFTDRFHNPSPAILGFMVASYDVSFIPSCRKRPLLHIWVTEMAKTEG